MDRTKTDFGAKLKRTLAQYMASRDTKYSFLKYYQDVVRVYFEMDVGARGVLIDHEMGLGKSILAVALMIDHIDTRPPLVILPKSLALNMRRSIHKYTRMRAESDPEWPIGMMNPTSLDAWIDKHISFVSMNAGNMLKQIDRATSDEVELEAQLESVLNLGNLDGRLLIIDEAHNLFRAITNGSKNGRGLYDLIMKSKNLKLCLLTGTMVANDPFELVSCFNMLGGTRPILPEDYSEFKKLYVHDGRTMENGIAPPKGTIRNKEYFQNRIFGLVSSMQHKLLEGDSVEFPERKPTEIVRVPMSGTQWVSYSLARDKEREEGKKPGGRMDVQRMQKPKSSKTSTYRVKSRQLSNWDPAEPESNKHRAIYDRIRMRSGQLGLVYSQFVGAGGMLGFRQLLERNGWTELVYAKSRSRSRADNADNTDAQSNITNALMDAVADAEDETIHGGKSEYLSPWEYVERLHKTELNEKIGGGESNGLKFAIYAGDVDIADRERVQEIFNDPANAHGEICALLLISSTGAEGLDLKRLRHIHIMEPYWNAGRHEQIIARGVRAGSHVDMPPEEKNVESFIYLSVEPVDFDPEHAKVREPTTDVDLYEEAVAGMVAVESFTSAVREVAIECGLEKCTDACKRKCRVCAPGGDQLFTFDPIADLKRDNPCKEAIDKEVEVTPYVLDGTTYYKAPDDQSPFGVAWFRKNVETDLYVQVEENDPLFDLLQTQDTNEFTPTS